MELHDGATVEWISCDHVSLQMSDFECVGVEKRVSGYRHTKVLGGFDFSRSSVCDGFHFGVCFGLVV